VTLSASVFMSLIVSLSTTPMLCAKFLEPMDKRKHGWFYRTGDRFIKWCGAEYARGLNWVLNNKFVVLGITLTTIGIAVYLFIIIPKGFFPQQDTGRLNGNLIAQQDISFYAMRQKSYRLAAIIGGDPGIEHSVMFIN